MKGIASNKMDLASQVKSAPRVALGDICEIATGKEDVSASSERGKYVFFTCAKTTYLIEHYEFDTEALLISGNGAYVGYIHYYKGKFNAYQRTYVLDKFINCAIHYVKHYLEIKLAKRIYEEKSSGNIPYIKLSTVSDIMIPLPSIEIQQKIVDTIVQWDKIIILLEKRIAAQTKLRTGTIQYFVNTKLKDTPSLSLSDIGIFYRGQNLTKEALSPTGKVKAIHYGQLYTEYNEVIDKVVSYTNISARITSEKGDILIPGSTTAGALGIAIASALMEKDVLIGGDINLLRISDKKKYNPEFTAYALSNYPVKKQLAVRAEGTTIKHLHAGTLSSVKIKFPSLEIQQEMVDTISTIDRSIEINRVLLNKYKEQRRGILQKIFGKN